MTNTENATVEHKGNDAIDFALNIREGAYPVILEERSTWDCDTARFAEHKTESTLANVWWTLLLYRDQTERNSERITFKFHENVSGGVDQSRKCWIFIETGESGEPDTLTFTFVPKSDI